MRNLLPFGSGFKFFDSLPEPIRGNSAENDRENSDACPSGERVSEKKQCCGNKNSRRYRVPPNAVGTYQVGTFSAKRVDGGSSSRVERPDAQDERVRKLLEIADHNKRGAQASGQPDRDIRCVETWMHGGDSLEKETLVSHCEENPWACHDRAI